MSKYKFHCKGCSGKGKSAEERIKRGDCYYHENGDYTAGDPNRK